MDERQALSEEQAEEYWMEDAERAAAALFKEKKPQRLNFQLLVKRNLPPSASDDDHEKQLENLNRLSHIRLDRERIQVIDGLELLGTRVTNLYLQHNEIRVIDNVDCLVNLMFLCLSHNHIRRVENLRRMNKLGFLDISHNQIEHLDVDELPESLIILDLRGNHCTQSRDHRHKLVEQLSRLRQIDGEEVSIEEKREAGYAIDESSDSSEEDSDEQTDTEIKGDESVRELKDLFHDFTQAVVIRSRERAERSQREHDRRTELLEQEDRATQERLTARDKRQRRLSESDSSAYGSRPVSSADSAKDEPLDHMTNRLHDRPSRDFVSHDECDSPDDLDVFLRSRPPSSVSVDSRVLSDTQEFRGSRLGAKGPPLPPVPKDT